MFFTPIQQIAGALLVKRIGDGANETAQKAGEAAEALKRIEQQNAETLKRIEAQNSEIRRLKAVEPKVVQIARTIKSQPKIEAKVSESKPPLETREFVDILKLEREKEAKRFAKTHPSMMICPKCGNATPKSTEKCRHCGSFHPRYNIEAQSSVNTEPKKKGLTRYESFQKRMEVREAGKASKIPKKWMY